MVAKSVLEDFDLTAWPKTSGSRGFHIYARIEPRWPFTDVRRAAVALAREVERRAPGIATSKWWKEERHGVFVDYNQNAKDRTIASAYSIRPLPDARVSTPLRWDEVADCDPAAFTIDTVPTRFAAVGDPWAEMDSAVGSLDGLLGLAERDEAAGLPDAPWPPHFVRQAGEEPRVQPSKRRAGRKTAASGAANAQGATAKATAAARGPRSRRTRGGGGQGRGRPPREGPRARRIRRARLRGRSGILPGQGRSPVRQSQLRLRQRQLRLRQRQLPLRQSQRPLRQRRPLPRPRPGPTTTVQGPSPAVPRAGASPRCR